MIKNIFISQQTLILTILSQVMCEKFSKEQQMFARQKTSPHLCTKSATTTALERVLHIF